MKVCYTGGAVKDCGSYYSVATNAVELRIWFLTDDILRIRAGFDGDWDEASYSLTMTAWESRTDELMKDCRKRVQSAAAALTDGDRQAVIQGARLKVVIEKAPFRIMVYDKDGSLLHADIPDLAYREDSNHRRIHASQIEADDCFYGFGEKSGEINKAEKYMNMAPGDAMGYNAKETDSLYKHIPFYIRLNRGTKQAVGYFYHNTAECDFNIRKVGDKYYFIYSSELSHELCYAVSDSPCRGFVYGGTLVDNADLGLCDTARYFTGNNHGSIEQINGRWYVFYHRHTNSSMFCRQGMVEPIEILPDGRIPQVEITTSGPNGAPLPAVELRELPAYAACNLYMTQPPQVNAEAGQNPFPYITQDGADVMPESESKPEAYICNLTPGTVVGFKYLNFQNVTKVSVKTRGMCYYGGFDVLLTADGEPIGTVSAARGNEWTWQTTELAIPDGISAIYFRMKGYGTLSLAAVKFH